MGLSSTAEGPEGRVPGASPSWTGGNKSSTEDLCYHTCSKVSSMFGAHRNQATLQYHADLDDLCRSMDTPELRREQMIATGPVSQHLVGSG